MITIVLCTLLFSLPAFADQPHDIVTNAVEIKAAPTWLKRTRVEKVIDRIQTQLEWTIRKVEVRWYRDRSAFLQSQNLGSGVRAVTQKSRGLILIGPSVQSADFDSVFGHELVHVILGQKYKDAIPGWLEEGLANFIAKHDRVDYSWLKGQPFPEDVKKLSHPFSNLIVSPRYHYQASQALAEMIAKKCDMANLLRLSVGEDLERYLETYCEIKDLNADFRTWINKKSGRTKGGNV